MIYNDLDERSAHETETPTFGQVVREMFLLAELQVKLARSDAREAMETMTRSIGALLISGLVFVASVPILLMALAECLIAAGLPRPAGYAIVGTVALVGAGVVALTVWANMRAAPRAFLRSQDEMKRNFAWFQEVAQDLADKRANAHSHHSHGL